MRKFAIAGIAVLSIAASSAVYAQHRSWFHHHERISPEDRAAFTDARIAAVHAGLKLMPDQEALWPPVEAAVRDFAKMRTDRANARMNGPGPDSGDVSKPDDPVARLRERADNMATSGAALKRIADAADPLYKTLDDGQKRRLAILTHMDGGFGGGGRHPGFQHHMMERGMMEHGMMDRDGDRGPDRGRFHERDGDRGDRGGPERL